MNGAGNAILIVDLRGSLARVEGPEARALYAPPGLAYDQLMEIADPRTPGAAAFVRIFNNDGSQAGACGNGTRCVAWWLTRGLAETTLTLETPAGALACAREDDATFTVDMGPPRLDWRDIPLSDPTPDTRAVALPQPVAGLRAFSAVNIGNPHAVFFVDDPERIDLATIGPGLETSPLFPEKANISIARVAARDLIDLKVWERGVGITLACGSAACATLVAAARADRTARSATVRLPGGALFIHWRESDGHVLMRGPVELEFEGRIDPAWLADTGP